LDRFLDPDTQHLIADAHEQAAFSDKFKAMTEALARVLVSERPRLEILFPSLFSFLVPTFAVSMFFTGYAVNY
jgi:hypothetical protein